MSSQRSVDLARMALDQCQRALTSQEGKSCVSVVFCAVFAEDNTNDPICSNSICDSNVSETQEHSFSNPKPLRPLRNCRTPTRFTPYEMRHCNSPSQQDAVGSKLTAHIRSLLPVSVRLNRERALKGKLQGKWTEFNMTGKQRRITVECGNKAYTGTKMVQKWNAEFLKSKLNGSPGFSKQTIQQSIPDVFSNLEAEVVPGCWKDLCELLPRDMSDAEVITFLEHHYDDHGNPQWLSL